MDRRSFLRTSALGGAAAAATTLAAPAVAQGRMTWRMVTTWPRNFPGMGVGAQRLADRITAATDGQLTGRTDGRVIDPSAKAEIFEDLLASGGYDRAASVAIGDGANDIGMIEAAGLGVAFCAKPALVAAADASVESRDLRAVIDLVAARADG